MLNPLYDKNDVLARVLDHFSPYSPLWSRAAYKNVSDKRLSNAYVETLNRKVKRTVHWNQKLPIYVGTHIARMKNAFNGANRTFLDENYRNAVHKPRISRQKVLMPSTPKKSVSNQSNKSTPKTPVQRKSPSPNRALLANTQEEGYNKRLKPISPIPTKSKFNFDSLSKFRQNLEKVAEVPDENDEEPRLRDFELCDLPKITCIRKLKIENSGFNLESKYFNGFEIVSIHASGLKVEHVLDQTSYLSLKNENRFFDSLVNFLISVLITMNEDLTNVYFLNTYKANTLFQLTTVKAKCQDLNQEDLLHLNDKSSIIFVPILFEHKNKNFNHFVLTVLDNRHRNFIFMDPMSDKKMLVKANEKATQLLQTYQTTVSQKSHQLLFLTHKVQKDSSSCGPIVVSFVDTLLDAIDPESLELMANNAFAEKTSPNYGSKSVIKKLRQHFDDLIQSLEVREYCTECNKKVEETSYILCYSCERAIHNKCFEDQATKCLRVESKTTCHKCLRFHLNTNK